MVKFKILLAKPWIRITFILIGAFILFEVTHSLWTAYRIKVKVNQISLLNDQFSPQRIEKTCPKEKFKTIYSCFREVVSKEVIKPLDSTGTILLMGMGVKSCMDDKSKGRCSELECTSNLIEMILDLVDPMIKADLPSKWSIFFADHVERSIQAQFASVFPTRTDSIIKEAENKVPSESNPDVTKRFSELKSRYNSLRPLFVERQKETDAIGSIVTIFLK